MCLIMKRKKKKGYNFIGAKIAIDEFLKENNITLLEHFSGDKYILLTINLKHTKS